MLFSNLSLLGFEQAEEIGIAFMHDDIVSKSHGAAETPI